MKADKDFGVQDVTVDIPINITDIDTNGTSSNEEKKFRKSPLCNAGFYFFLFGWHCGDEDGQVLGARPICEPAIVAPMKAHGDSVDIMGGLTFLEWIGKGICEPQYIILTTPYGNYTTPMLEAPQSSNISTSLDEVKEATTKAHAELEATARVAQDEEAFKLVGGLHRAGHLEGIGVALQLAGRISEAAQTPRLGWKLFFFDVPDADCMAAGKGGRGS
uniref:Uncharacterized protein n=1 Tax=Chromera velia CCMP2878 TaxID=1169474 RepID=A0A0G4IDQ6_9ALVE|eukprot:Cvel_13454.t1-p1 / transcript=Cvel_13454.t1 / gene=Cvel_13454 / organism=Chromera_velia_CCMP2878 / gene_product=hypothetical protein / transcript_product=hypothetical protein / location=Cvel_scaffold919:47948-53812(-) / protein_length=217 / sequence_SO=supercontig / SO=protein_coding / is_pseudo=false